MRSNISQITRRAFVASACTAACALPLANADEASWDYEADVVVVGLGGAGAAAAAAALENGASVLVLEGEDHGGGCTAICGGLIYMGGGTPCQAALGVEDTPDNFKAYMTAAMGVSAEPELLDVFCNESVDLYNWLVGYGVTFDGGVMLKEHIVEAPEGIVLNYSGNERAPEYAAVAKPAPRGHTPNGGGAAVFNVLLRSIEASPASQVLYNTRGTELVQDEQGAVIGVVAVDENGAVIRVRATGGVVLAAGAFTNNDQLLADLAPEALRSAGKTGLPSDRGDGILMGLKAGAATRSMSRINISEFMYMYGDLAAGVMLDKYGLRFLAEDWYGSWIGRTVMNHTIDKCFILADEAVMTDVRETFYGGFLVPVATADTVEELAEALDLPVQNVIDSVERYNGHCAAGVDGDYGKDDMYLRPLATPPFYAFDSTLVMGYFHTLGGLKIDANAQVVDLDGNPIPGLYAAGRTSAGIFGDYPASGTSVADCLTFGRIAGWSAAGRTA